MKFTGATEERFWSKVSRSGPDECWEWTAGATSAGYGAFYPTPGGVQVSAHRYSYELIVGPIPEGLDIDHLCRNRRCVNPVHLEPVTRRENVLRGESPAAERARKTHCKRGHPLEGDNLSFIGTRRQCRECRRARQRRYWQEGKKR